MLFEQQLILIFLYSMQPDKDICQEYKHLFCIRKSCADDFFKMNKDKFDIMNLF